MSKPTIGVFFGSRSAEHDVSIITAISSIIKPLNLTHNYNIMPVYITKEGKWYADKKLADVNLYTSGEIDNWLRKQKPVAMQIGDGLYILKQGLKKETIQIDIAFPATHGTHGEDGELMGIFEMAGIPYVGCDVSASSVAMDKVNAKLIAQSQGVAVSKFKAYTTATYSDSSVKEIEKELKYPLFVKPAHLGSSIGISRVTDTTTLTNAIELAFYYDNKIIVEEAVNNLIEVTQPIIGNDKLTLAHLEQPIVHEDGVFDFDTKYMNQGKGGKKMGGEASQGSQGYSRLPADLPKDLYKTAQEVASTVYKSIGCTGIARVDLLIDSKTNVVYFNEINPLPGSLYAHNWRAAGVSNVELVERLVELAKERHDKGREKQTVFATNFLQQF